MEGLPIRMMEFPGYGFGVMATRDISEGEAIETARVLCFPGTDLLPGCTLMDYIHHGHDGMYRLGLGYIDIYNHSNTNNAQYEFDDENQTCTIIAIKDIGEEMQIFCNYGSTWFEHRRLPQANRSWKQ